MFLYKTSLPNGRIHICNWVLERLQTLLTDFIHYLLLHHTWR